MAKAINWPVQYRDHVLQEPSYQPLCAVRLGRLYYDNQFWVPEEEVDIRVNNLRVRRGKVLEALTCFTLSQLPQPVYALLKPDIQTQAALLAYLGRTYNQSVTPSSEVTVVTYQNLPVNPEEMDKPLR
jgi:hypothetical protein